MLRKKCEGMGIGIAMMCLVSFFYGIGSAGGAEISGLTYECLDCHRTLHPGLVSAWEKSRHAQESPGEALKEKGLKLKVSSKSVPENLKENVVGCAECHTLNSDKHKDSFNHNGYKVHTIVTPDDCATCHAVEASQYEKNIMSHAYGNLVRNVVHQDLAKSVNGAYKFEGGKLTIESPEALTDEDSCLFCHGTKVEVKGIERRETDFGELEFPVLSGWPNQGVGRINPDGSRGSCAACHARHQFPIEMARKPHTCSECHKGPDVPAYKVYQVSKHGNIYSSVGKKEWDFQSVPWEIGEHFTAPTCATCHVSLLVDADGMMVVERTHQMNDRLPWRIFGLPYAHPHPKSPDTTSIRNMAGLPLPTELTGEPVSEFLIDAEEQDKRRRKMQRACLTCHGTEWVDGHWERFENTIEASNDLTLTASKMLMSIWQEGWAKGIEHEDSIFNEAVERKWADVWLLYGNSVRFSSAMAGADYGVFDRGRHYMTRNIQEIKDWIDLHSKLK